MPDHSLKIAYVSVDDPNDMHVWSGIHYSIFTSLKRNIGEVEALGPYENRIINLILKIKKAYYKLLFHKRYNQYHSQLLSKSYGRYFSSKLKEKHYDLIIAVSASAEIAYLKTHTPIVLVSDALFSNALNYYPTLTDLSDASITESFKTEAQALRNSAFLYAPSEWVKLSAIKDFHIPENKITIGPMGANLTNIPDKDFVFDYKKKKDNSIINLLFVGVNWDNKGGAIAYECLLELLKAGQQARLTIVGCKVPQEIKHDNLINIPFIKKTTEEGRKAFEDLYLNADFHILPTRFEAFGIVFCEASAYGVINIATKTGGTPSSIQEGENGFLMSPGSNGIDYAKKITSIYADKEKLHSLQISSRERYDEILNWDVWARNLVKILKEKQLLKLPELNK